MKPIIILLFCCLLLIPFQNCSVYKSDGRKDFDSSIEQASNKGCYPYIDTNVAMTYLGIGDDSLSVFKAQVSGEDADFCDFKATGHVLSHINCKVSQGNGDQTLLLIQDGAAAFEGTVAVWTASTGGVVSGFKGTNHGGYITLDADGMYTIRYLALDNLESKGVGCAVRLTVANYNANVTATRNALSKITQEMAINNQQ